MNILVAGASGMVGSEVVRLAAADPAVDEVTAIVRQPTRFGQRTTTIIHKDFCDYASLMDVFARHDACIWCLGISQSRVSAKEYFSITHDYVVAAAKAVRQANPSMRFIFLSAMGADPTGRTRIRFGRVKGAAEKSLDSLGLEQLYIFRPGAIIANPLYRQRGWHKAVEQFMMRSFAMLLPHRAVYVTDLARLMLQVAVTGGERHLFPQEVIDQLARQPRHS